MLISCNRMTSRDKSLTVNEKSVDDQPPTLLSVSGYNASKLSTLPVKRPMKARFKCFQPRFYKRGLRVK